MTSRHSLWFYCKFYFLSALILFSVNTQGQEDILTYFHRVDLPDEYVIHADAEDTIRNLLDTLLNRLKCVQAGLNFFECFRCLTPKSVWKTLSVKHTLNLSHIRKLSVIFLYHIFNFETICKQQPDSSVTIDYDHYWNSTKVLLVEGEENTLSLSKMHKVMRGVKMVYQPLQLQQCATIEDFWEIRNQTEQLTANEIELFASVFMSYILRGQCLSSVGTYEDFVDQIFLKYADSCTGKLTVEGIERLIKRVIGSPEDTASQKEKEECPKERSEFVAHTRYSIRIDPPESYQTSELNASSVDKGTHHSRNDSENPIENRLYKRTKRSVGYPVVDNESSNLATKCWKTGDLITLFQPADNGSISHEEFSQLCPALLQQIIAGCCKPTSAASLEKEIKKEEIALAELYCYSSLAVLIISLSSLGGVLLMPLVSSGAYHYIMAGLIALAFSTMTCDVFLHLIPQGLGLHDHFSKFEEIDSEDHPTAHVQSVCHQVTVLMAIYILFLFEAITEITVKSKHHKKDIVKFLYYPPQTEDEKHHSVSIRIRCVSALSNTIKEKNESHMDPAKRPRSVAFITPVEGDKAPNDAPILKSEKICGGLTSVAWCVTMADSFHNFGDGLAIGTSFHNSLESGLLTSIAVLCHEIPHEFGDFAILLSTGLSFAKALAINFISALSCFIGLYVGLQIGDNRETRKWIMSATAGIFLYVSLAEILPELRKTRGMNPYKMLVIKNIGIILGAVFMALIAAYEEKVNV